jgi:predicted 3-demethylubiquinone-9 3-methyltransferase (glyoxalase superfamily)
MKELITPCLWFDNQAREAGAFYTEHLANAKIAGQSPIVTELDIAGQHLTLLDGGPMYKPNPSISLYYSCSTKEEITRTWDAFSKEGSVLMPLDKYEWSESYGWLTDKFGISWQFSLESEPYSGKRMTPFFLFVGSQYGRAEEAFKFYSTIFKNSQVRDIRRYGNDEAPDQEGNIKLAHVTLSGQPFMFVESAHAHPFAFSEGVSLTVHCETQQEIDYYWERLTESGKESMCGWLKDRFGVSWQIIPNILNKVMTDPVKAGKAAKAFMQMRKFDIEKIVQATLD